MKIPTRSNIANINWDNFKYMVFDVPNQATTYAERYAVLGMLTIAPKTLISISETHMRSNKAPFISIAPKTECKDVDHLEQVFQDIVDKGGEGIILRDPQAPFKEGRSPGYLKHKVLIL